MAKTIKDTDYLVISARVKALETGLLTAERMEQILDAKSGEDAGKLLQEWGYPQLDPRRPEAMDAALSAVREATLADLAEGTPDARYIDLFKVKYDYHNVKALLKAEAVGTAPDRMLMDMGRVSTAELAEAVRSRELDGLPETLAAAVVEAREVLDTTRDPQLSDIVLDRWCYRDMAALAEETGSAFLRGYVAVQVDAVNLRTAVRTLRMGKGADFLLGALLEGGDLAPDAVAKAASSGAAGLRELYGATRFRDAAEAGAEALKGGPLTAFEKLCDDAVGDYLAGAQSVPFGEAPLVSYLAARETEYTNLRILLMGRAAGIDGDPHPPAGKLCVRRRRHGHNVSDRRDRQLGVRHGLSGPGTGDVSRHRPRGGPGDHPGAGKERRLRHHLSDGAAGKGPAGRAGPV